MIKFFRHIRENLLMENPPAGRAGKTGKYLKYAVGEIFLVVIGILIALQINNWNESRKLNRSIKESLSEVQNNLVNDSLQMTRIFERMNKELKLQKEIIDAIENRIALDSTFNDNFGHCMTINLIQVTQNGYQNLQELGVRNIKNKDLETLLINYYDVHSKEMEREVKDDNVDLMNVWLPYVRKNFRDFNYRNYAIPKSYEKLSSDSEFLLMLKININNREATLRELTNMQATLRTLITKLNNQK
jgi:hypothetical protein